MAAWITLVVLVALLGTAGWLYTPDKPRQVLEAAYSGPADYLAVAGLRLRLLDTGPRDAPALILLHGFGSSLETWGPWAERLSPTYRVIRFDLPGFGLTGPDPAGAYTDARTVAVLLAVMDRLRLARATIIGNSLGGKIAWMFAAAHPERVASLVLISPDGFASRGFEYDKPAKVPFLVRLLPYVLPRNLLCSTLAPAYDDPAAMTDALVTRYRDMMLAPGARAAMVARMRQVRLTDPVPLLRRIEAPVLLLWGEKDRLIPFTNAADYMAALPHAELAPLPGLGHVPFEEAPDRSLAPVLPFLQVHASG